VPLLLAAALHGASPAPKPLAAFGPSFNLAGVKTTDARVVIRGEWLHISTGHKEQWPGIALSAPGTWDLSPFGQIEIDVKNTGSAQLTVSCRVDNSGADGVSKCVSGSVKIEPGQMQTVQVELRRASSSRLDGKLFGMRGYPVAPGGPGTVDPAKVTEILVFVAKPTAANEFEIAHVRASGSYVPPTAWVSDATPFFPFIDAFGQYRHKDWPGKVHSLDELKQQRDTEAKELRDNPEPSGRDKYGGWTLGPQLKATGFFRTEKREGKWWLVDPDGRLFFSQGIDCVRARHMTPTEERTNWFENFPGDQPECKQFAGSGYALKGHYAGRTVKTFSFNAANLFRKYGAEWDTAYSDVVHRRLRSWGINTIGMWSDEKVRLERRTPYVDAIGSHGVKMIAGSDGYWGKFPDPFEPGFAEQLRRQMQGKRGRSAGDPWCLGFFCDNEMSWGDDVSLAIGALRSPATQAAKKAFVEDLRSKYGAADKLNAAWGTEHASWDALLQSTNAPERKRAEADLAAFYSKTAEQYFRTVRDAIKAVAPGQLYLGCRFAWVNARAAAAAGKYCDVVSYNLYRRSIADFQFNGGADVPLIVGEFHLGALDRGMFHTGLVPVATQQARGAIYRSYVEGALRHPQFVGCHWFEYQDEPLTGRVYDEENYQIGFVDVADTPYAETVAAARAVAAGMYELRSGK